MAKYVGAIDQGTTRTRFMIFDHDGREVARHQLEHEQITPAPGWLEHDPHEIWETTQDVVSAAMGRAGISFDDLVAIGIANQSGTTVVWDRRTGEPYCHAIVRDDTRTGDAGSSGAARIRWILDQIEGVRADAEAGHAIFGTIDSWLIWCLTGGPEGGRHLIDVTNAASTMLVDPVSLVWDEELLAERGIPAPMLPQIRSSSEVYGTTEEDGPFGGAVAIAGDLADRQAALVGQGCFAAGDLAIGDAGVVMLNTGTELVRSSRGLLTTPAYRFADAPPVHALEGDGAAVDIIEAMIDDSGLHPRMLRVSGVLGADESAMQALADALGVPVSRPVVIETPALGAAYAAGLAVGFWASTDELVADLDESRRWEPAARRA